MSGYGRMHILKIKVLKKAIFYEIKIFDLRMLCFTGNKVRKFVIYTIIAKISNSSTLIFTEARREHSAYKINGKRVNKWNKVSKLKEC